jgi:hypothetical protein
LIHIYKIQKHSFLKLPSTFGLQPQRVSWSDNNSNIALSITDDDPRTVREAVNSEDSKLWNNSMVEEMDALDKNEAWDIVELPARRKYVGRKWLFKKKLNA